MKKLALAAALSVAATASLAGGMSAPTIEPAPIADDVKASSSSSGGILVPLLLVVLLAAAVSN